MPHRRCVVCERVMPARGLKRVYPQHCVLLKKPDIGGNAICTACYDTHRRTSQTVATVMSDEASEFDVARAKVRCAAYSMQLCSPLLLVYVSLISCVVLFCVLPLVQMENKRLRYVVKAMYRRYTLHASAASDHSQAKEGMQTAAAVSSSSPPLLASISSQTPQPLPSPPPSDPTPTTEMSEMSVGRVNRKRPKAWDTSTHVTNDLCEVCAEQPSRKKELLFAGCLHGMCRPCMTAHLKARRRCCHVCQVDFQDRLLEVESPVTIRHVLAESKNTGSCAVQRRRKIC